MGKDRIRISIKGVNINSLRNDKSQWSIQYNKDLGDKYKSRMSYYSYGSMICNLGIFNVSYLRYSNTYGDMYISFSIAKLYNGNNSTPKSNIFTADLIKRIYNGIDSIVYVDSLPSSETMKITKDETNIDIIDTIENIEARFKLFKKIKIPHRRLDCKLGNDGTLYFYSGKDKNKSSAVIIIYFKGREQQHRNNSIYRLLNIDEGKEDLRIEFKNMRYSLNKKVERVRNLIRMREIAYPMINANCYKSLDFDIKTSIDMNMCVIPATTITPDFKSVFCNRRFYIDINITSFQMYNCNNLSIYIQYSKFNNKSNVEILMSKEYQYNLINHFINQCCLNKRITTKDKLYKIIDESELFTRTKKKAAKRVIRYLNGEIYSISLSDKTISDYKKLIIKTGYHYLYSDGELEPITEKDIFMCIEQDKFINIVDVHD
ncbi:MULTISPECIES: hypothetical protein [unclassified Clostridium]|uniref:hypothetical protein n=1 Tax=unclassified Clostridium TaxID=2614128 RepID=UPI0002975E50|nr:MULTISPECIES: hypothetical protein [unclassified Clostridium]EKQ57250.1 MAG: hypothetical protein A370_01067 [Clostridium sp. Maddingley MBC34-26]